MHQPGLNEELGATAVMGSQMASTFPKRQLRRCPRRLVRQVARCRPRRRRVPPRGLCRHRNRAAASSRWPATIPSNKSSTLPSSSEIALADLHLPILHPGNVQEVLDLGLPRHRASRASSACGAPSRSSPRWPTARATSKSAPTGSTRRSPSSSGTGKPYAPRVNGDLGRSCRPTTWKPRSTRPGSRWPAVRRGRTT